MSEQLFDAERLAEVIGGALNSVEDVQRALTPGLHGTVAPVYRGARAGVATAARVVAWSPQLSELATRMLTSDTVRLLTGMVEGVLGTPRDTRPTEMTVRVASRRVRLDRDSLAAAYPSARGRLVVLLHGLIETERWWFHRPGPRRTGTDFGSRLAEDLPCTPVYVRYHSGRPVAANGADLVDLLTELVAAWPVPVTDIVLMGHSMGGLVARSAVLQSKDLPNLTRVVSLGTPFGGAPLERVVARSAPVCAGVAGLRPFARLMALRSDGIKDLAAASQDDDWPEGVREYRLGATVLRSAESRLARFVGDLVVGPARPDTARATVEHALLAGLHHLDLLHHDTVYDAVLAWLRRDALESPVSPTLAA